MDNISLDRAVAPDALRTAVNVDVLDDGTQRRRSGMTLRVAGPAHSAWPPDGKGSALYAVVDGVLTRYTRALSGALSGTPLRSGMSPDLPVAFVEVGGEVYYSNGSVTGKVVGGLHRPWGVERPSGQPKLAALTSGALYAGRYQVAATFVDSTGEQSGTGPTAAIDVVAGGGISLTGIPQPVDASVTRIRVFVSEANGEILYRYADLAVGTTTLTIARSSTLGMDLRTQFLMPPVPGTVLEHFGSHIYVGRSNLVFFTEALSYGLMKQTGYLPAFDDEVRVIKAGSTGLWIATASRTMFLQGSGPQDFQPIEKLPFGAAKGAVTELPDGKLVWMGTQGLVVATPQGQIEDLVDSKGEPLAHIAVDEHARGSAVVREQNGVRQIIAAMDGGVASELDSSDHFDIEIIRKNLGF